MNRISPKSLSTSPLFICNASGLRLELEVNSRCCHFFVCVGLGVFPFWVCLVGVHLLAIPGYADTRFTIDNWLVKNCDLISFISRTTRKLWFDIIYSIFFWFLLFTLYTSKGNPRKGKGSWRGSNPPPPISAGAFPEHLPFSTWLAHNQNTQPRAYVNIFFPLKIPTVLSYYDLPIHWPLPIFQPRSFKLFFVKKKASLSHILQL